MFKKWNLYDSYLGLFVLFTVNKLKEFSLHYVQADKISHQ